MRIMVEYLGFIKNMVNKRFQELVLKEGTTLDELLCKLSDLYGTAFTKNVFQHGQKDVKYGFVVTVNGVLIGQLQGIDTKLSEGDHVILMSLMSGG